MKTLVTTLYMSTTTQITIDLEFQFQVQNKANGTVTNMVFTNDDSDFGNIRITPYFKFIHTYFNGPTPVRSKPIYLSPYHIFDLKANMAKIIKLLQDPKSFARNENGEYYATEAAKQASHWALRDIGKEKHSMTMVLYPCYKTTVDPNTDVETRIFEPGVAFRMSTMPKDAKGRTQAVSFSLNEFKSIYTTIASINVVDLILMGGMVELFDQRFKTLSEKLERQHNYQPKRGDGYGIQTQPKSIPLPNNPGPSAKITSGSSSYHQDPEVTVVTTQTQDDVEKNNVSVKKPYDGGLPARNETQPEIENDDEISIITPESVDEIENDADQAAIDDIFDDARED